MNMKKILEMKAKREDARLKAMAVLNKAEAEDRFLSEDKQKDIDKKEEEISAWDESIGRAEKLLAIEPEDRSTEKPEVKPTPSKDNEKRFASFGEQLMAAYRAATPGGKVDERLTTRAASGLNESTPSDGGFLVQQDFVTELLKRTYENEELIAITKELTDTLRKNKTIDWQKRESARAKMRMLIKKLLKKHKYPPEGMDDAVQTVMTQCELWTDNIMD